MIKKNSEKRMYCLVPYNLSPIQQGIQSAHCIAEYGYKLWEDDIFAKKKTKKTKEVDFQKYLDWVKECKTIIILNGGTTNNNKSDKWYGTLQKHRDKLKELGVIFSEFHEPDLNYALTAVSFIVDMKDDWIVLKYLENIQLA